ncbi:MAG: phosphatidylglycerophosphatase A [Planctomycetota bacterium]
MAVWLATGFGVGLVAPAPGTIGALWGLPWAWWLTSGSAPAWAWLSVPIGVLLGGPLCGRAARDLGGHKDPGAVVWDEIATVPLVFVLAPSVGPWWLLIGFGLHRLFDITKPPPCRRLERLPGGWGIMLDDVAAAGYAAIGLGGLRQLWGLL